MSAPAGRRLWRSRMTALAVTDDMAFPGAPEPQPGVWLVVPGWSGRRAVAVPAGPFAAAAGCTAAGLPGRVFYARTAAPTDLDDVDPDELVAIHDIEPAGEDGTARRLGAGYSDGEDNRGA